MSAAARRLLIAGALLMALATILGAFGAHALKSVLAPDRLDTFKTGVQYQFFHALGLLGIGLMAERRPAPLLERGGAVVLAGILLFSGSLYMLVAGAPRWLGMVTPLGGLCLIGGWLMVAVALLRGSR